jgi:hypothetical protein
MDDRIVDTPPQRAMDCLWRTGLPRRDEQVECVSATVPFHDRFDACSVIGSSYTV